MKLFNFYSYSSFTVKMFLLYWDKGINNRNRPGFLNNTDISIISKDFVLIDIKTGLVKLKKILNISTIISFNNGIILILFLHSYKRFFIRELTSPVLKNFYILFIDKIYGFFARFKYFITVYKHFKHFSNYNDIKLGASRLPSLVFCTKRCTKIYNKFFFNFLKLRILTIKDNGIIDSKDSIAFNIFLNDSLLLYSFLRNIHILNKYVTYKQW